MNKKGSGQKISTKASKIMRSNNSSQIQKSLAASVLSQRNTGKITGSAMESKASKVMNSNKYWLYKLFRGFVKISFNEVCGVYERKTIIIFHTLN